MKVLFLAPYPLTPANFGGAIRISALRDGLVALGHCVDVVAIDASQRSNAVAVDPHLKGIYSGRPRLAKASILVRAFSPLPEPALAVQNRLLRQRLKAADNAYDVVVLHQSQVAQYRRCFSRSICVLDAQNLEHDLYLQRVSTASGVAQKVRFWAEGRKFQRLERRAFQEVALTIAVSQQDADRIHSFAGILPAIVPNGVDIEAIPYAPPIAILSQPLRVLFVGSLGYTANIRAVLRLHARIMPLVRRRFSDATLVIVGKGPSPEVRELALSPMTELHADVREVLDFYRTSHVAAVPLDIGGGTRLKALEALAAGIPVVATPLALEGLPLLNEVHAIVASTDQQFADSIVRACIDTRLRQSLSSAGRALVEQLFDWRRLSAKYAEELEAVLAPMATTREH